MRFRKFSPEFVELVRVYFQHIGCRAHRKIWRQAFEHTLRIDPNLNNTREQMLLNWVDGIRLWYK